jgi:phosphatidylglycerophosphate synthase
MHRNPILCLVGSRGPTLFGLSTDERLRRQFAGEGVAICLTPDAAAHHDGSVSVVLAEAVLDQPLVPVLIETPKLLLMGEGPCGNKPLAAHVQARDVATTVAFLSGAKSISPGFDLNIRAPGELELGFWKTLRKRETPYALAVSSDTVESVEWRMFKGTYKGATDIVTKYLWPVPAFHATRWLAALGVSANMVTAFGFILMVLAFWLFLKGDFALGLAAAWLMTFLDTVDGKLARVTLTSSKWGDIFDHGIDLLHPPFWYVAWAMGLGAVGLAWPPSTFWLVIAAILGGYVAQRMMEGIAIKWLGLEIHIWRKLDTLFRQITARRNPNLILLTAGVLIGRPDWGLIAVAIWTLTCLLLHGVQLVQALSARRGGPLTSWMTQG